MAKSKGIRVNQLAKELGIPSKVILDRIKVEGLGEKVPNHMSLMSLGLAETVREWFASAAGGLATAVESDVAVKPKAVRRRKKTEGDEGAGGEVSHEEEAHPKQETAGEAPSASEKKVEATAGESAVAPEVPKETSEVVAEEKALVEQEVVEKPAPAAAPVEAAPAQVKPAVRAPEEAAPSPAVAEVPAPAPTTAPVEPVAPVVPAAPVIPAAEKATPAPAVVVPPVATAPAAPAIPAAPAALVVPPAERPAATAPVAPAAPVSKPQAGPEHGRGPRPTVSMPSRHGAAGSGRPGISGMGRPGAPGMGGPGAAGTPVRKPITPAPRLLVPAPAKIQGPRIVREEEPDIVPTPRPRRGPVEQSTPAFVQARPQGGRGVKSTKDDEDESAEAAKKKSKGGGRTLSSRRRGPDGRRGEAMEKLKEYTEADLIERRDRLAAASSYRAGFDSELKKKAGRGTHAQAKSAAQRGGALQITEPVTIRSLSAALGVKSNELMLKLMRQGVMASINQALNRDMALKLAMDYGVDLEIQAELSLEDQLEKDLASREVNPEDLKPRSPVVTILGHVDHGKTSLLDKIRQTNVAAGEAGGITQHVAAWVVELGEKRVTFIDTPGHQAFTSMRARGANMTDVVVLVVSAAEGVQPQTIESINHARAAKVPIVVALNKIDRPDANPDMVLGQLAKEGLNPVEWGGDTEVVRTSATTGQGIPDLIEILYYQADLLELKADPTAPARGMVIESFMDDGLGPVATVLVQNGTLKPGDVVLSGASYGRIRSLLNDRRQMIAEAGPATPVIISGLNGLPDAGSKFVVVEGQDAARTVAEDRENRNRQKQLALQNKVTLSNLMATMKAGDTKTINLIVKADVQGSIETLAKTVTDYNTEEVKVQVIHAAVGGITESDVELAAATRDENSNTVIIGFHVVPDEAARQLAEQRDVEIRLYRVIYEIFDDLKKALSGMLEPEIREKLHGHVEIRQIFKVSRVGNIAGCFVTDGHVQRGSKIRLIRNGVVVVDELTMESLKRQKDDVKEVKAGLECGIKLAGYDDIKVGDRLEAYVRETIRRTL